MDFTVTQLKRLHLENTELLSYLKKGALRTLFFVERRKAPLNYGITFAQTLGTLRHTHTLHSLSILCVESKLFAQKCSFDK